MAIMAIQPGYVDMADCCVFVKPTRAAKWIIVGFIVLIEDLLRTCHVVIRSRNVVSKRMVSRSWRLERAREVGCLAQPWLQLPQAHDKEGTDDRPISES
jgi:hypothetical protein